MLNKLLHKVKNLQHRITISRYKISALIVLFLLVFSIGFFEFKYKDKFYPGVRVGGMSVGDMTYADVSAYFKKQEMEMKEDGLAVDFESSAGIKKVNIPVSVAGLTPDNSVEYFSFGELELDIGKAYDFGRGSDVFHDLFNQFSLVFKYRDFEFSNNLQRDAMDSLLNGNMYLLLTKSSRASFALQKEDVFIVKEKVGEAIDKEGLLNIIEGKVKNLDLSPVYIKSSPDMPNVTQEKLEPFLDIARIFSNKINLVFQYHGYEWKIKGSRLVTWLTLNEEGSVVIDDGKLGGYLEINVLGVVDNPPKNGRFAIQNGKLVEIVPGKKGFVVNQDKIKEQINSFLVKVQTDSRSTLSSYLNLRDLEKNIEVKNGTLYLKIETIEVDPKITKDTIEKYHIQNLVGQVRTSFKGSTLDREHNIKIGIATINGMLIAPGAEFSTVAAIGRVTEAEGYVKEMVIKEDKTTKEFGGGLCQVATTLFRLALNAGLSITERVNHRFVVHYYDPPGLDATIYGPHPDFRFVNDTSNYLLLQARVENQQVIMELYGQKDNRVSEISKPVLSAKIPAPPTKYLKSADIPVGTQKCLESPHDGVTTDVLYTVKYPNGDIKSKNFHSVYQPWQKVCLIGTGPY